MKLSQILKTYNKLKYTSFDDIKTDSEEFKFNGFLSLQSFIENRKNKKIRKSEHSASEHHYDNGFNSHDSFETALDQLKYPKNNIVNNNITKKIIMGQKRLWQVSDSGDSIDIPSYLSGSPNYFISFQNRTKIKIETGKTVFLMVNALADISSKNLEAYLTKSIIDIYSKYYLPKVIVCTISDLRDGRTSQIFIDVPIKNTKNLDKVNFADFFRRLIFFVKEQDSKLPYGYGRTIENVQIDTESAKIYNYYAQT